MNNKSMSKNVRSTVNSRQRNIRTYTNVRQPGLPGNMNRPPTNTGTIQVPRPVFSRPQIIKRTLKQEYVLSTGSPNPVFFSASVYAPFYTASGGASSYSFNQPASLTNMFATFGLYKVKQVQLIFEPLTISTTVPAPYTVGMVADVASPLLSTFTNANMIQYQNANKISPAYPSEVRYLPPKITAEGNTQLILSGGWIESQTGSTPGNYGFVVVTQNGSGYTSSSPYTNLTLVYELWFKNPN